MFSVVTIDQHTTGKQDTSGGNELLKKRVKISRRERRRNDTIRNIIKTKTRLWKQWRKEALHSTDISEGRND